MQNLVQGALLCCFFISVAIADKVEDSCPFFDNHLDDVLTNKVRERLSDPFQLPPQLGDLTEEVVWGLSNITKSENAEISCKKGTTSIKLILTTYELKGPYTFTKEGKLASDKDGYVDVKCHDFQAKVEATFAKGKDGKVRTELQRLQIEGIEFANIDSNGRCYPQHQTKAELVDLTNDSKQRIELWKRAIRYSLQEAIEKVLKTLATNIDRGTDGARIAVVKAEEDTCLAIDNHLDDVLENVRKSLPDPLQVTSSSMADDLVWGLSDVDLLEKPEISCTGRTTFVKLTLTSPELTGRYKLTDDAKLFSDKDGDLELISGVFQAKVEATVVKGQDGEIRAELRRVLLSRLEAIKLDMTKYDSTSFTRGELQGLQQDVEKILDRWEKAVQKSLRQAIETELRKISMKEWVI